MYYFKLVDTLKFDFKMDVTISLKVLLSQRDLEALKKLNTGHSTRNDRKVTHDFTMKRQTALICYLTYIVRLRKYEYLKVNRYWCL